jgi:hypothetical protein
MSAPVRDPGATSRSPTENLLRDLLPRFYWLRDAQSGGALEALIAALAAEYEGLHGSVAALYDELFIETCSPGIVPYIGDEVGVTGLGPVTGPGVGDRAWVGRVIGLRRNKGTLATVARAAAAATGWATFAQDGRSVTAHTQSALFPQPDRGRLVDVRRARSVRMPDAPWSSVTRGASVAGRPLRAGMPAPARWAARAGYPAPLTVELAIWRLQSFPVTRRAPKRLDQLEGRAFTFHPAGIDSPLFAVPEHTRDRLGPPAPSELPLPLSQALGAAPATTASPLDASVAVWRRDHHGRTRPVPLVAGDLSEWRRAHGGDAEAVVDPRLGRLLFPGSRPEGVQASYAYGFSGELGGGPYGDASSYAARREDTTVFHVSQAGPPAESDVPDAPAAYQTLDDAIAAAAELPRHSDCLVLVGDSATYRPPGDVWRIRLSGGRRLRIASTPMAAPVLEGSLEVHVEAGSRMELSGLTILGAIAVEGHGELAVEHSTLAPGAAASVFAPGRSAPAIALSYAILGRIDAGREARVAASSTIVDGRGEDAFGSAERPAGTLDLRTVTVLGATTGRRIVAQDSIFTEPVTSLSPREGLIRASFVPDGSTAEVLVGCPPAGGGAARGGPRFTSTRWGDPGYAQLDLRGPREIAEGAGRNGEMGAFNWLRQPTRFARLPIVLHEMLPAGVAARVDYRN